MLRSTSRPGACSGLPDHTPSRMFGAHMMTPTRGTPSGALGFSPLAYRSLGGDLAMGSGEGWLSLACMPIAPCLHILSLLHWGGVGSEHKHVCVIQYCPIAADPN